MDFIIRSLFELIPEPFRPYVAFGLLVLYVVTKARSASKTKKITTLVLVVRPKPKDGEKGLLRAPSKWDKLVDAIF
jgi:hypothetical protein